MDDIRFRNKCIRERLERFIKEHERPKWYQIIFGYPQSDAINAAKVQLEEMNKHGI